MTQPTDEQDSLVDFWKDPDQPGVFHLDIRRLIEEQGEPYSTIMACVNDLKTHEALVLHAPFEPRPMMLQLQRMNFTLELVRCDAEHFTLTIRRPSSS